MRQQWKLIAGVCAVILIVVFALQNVNTVQVTFLIFQAQLPMVLVLLISVLFGLLLGFLSSLSAHMNVRATDKHLQKEREALQKAQVDWEANRQSLVTDHEAALAAKDQEITELKAALATAQVMPDVSSTDEVEATLDQSAQELEAGIDEFESSLNDDEDPQVSRG